MRVHEVIIEKYFWVCWVEVMALAMRKSMGNEADWRNAKKLCQLQESNHIQTMVYRDYNHIPLPAQALAIIGNLLDGGAVRESAAIDPWGP